MTTTLPTEHDHGGLLARFARHPTAANLVLLLMLLGGLAALFRLNTQFFPDFEVELITITVNWPGASAEDVDQAVVQTIEPEVRFLDQLRRVNTVAREGSAMIFLEYQFGIDMQAALADVETAVARISSLPEAAEPPEIRRLLFHETIGRLLLSGPYPEDFLSRLARDIRDLLLARGVSRVELVGDRDEEIWVEVPPGELRRRDLGLAEIAARIGALSRDIPAGDLASGERQIRSLGLRRDAETLEELAIRARPGGEQLRLGDLATVREARAEDQVSVAYRGQPAVALTIQRARNADALDQAAIVEAVLAELRPTLPADLQLLHYQVQTEYIRERIRLLLENGSSGLILVVAVLFLFLHPRVAFWVAVGIPASLLATLAVMDLAGQSINMVSLFGLIMAIGIVVDDAIVVGEHAEALAGEGLAALDAAIHGARRMAAPVLSASLTTCCAFYPVFLIDGPIGTILAAIPLVVISVILASLLECFLVLPGHLRGALAARPASHGPLARFRRGFDARFGRFRDGPFRQLVVIAIAHRYSTVAAALAVLLVCLGLLGGGRVGFQFFPTPEPSLLVANLEMDAATDRAATSAALAEVEAGLRRAVAALADDGEALLQIAVPHTGTTLSSEQAVLQTIGSETEGALLVELVPPDARSVRNGPLIRRWQAEIAPIPGLVSLAIQPFDTGAPGEELDVRLIGEDLHALRAGADEVRALLARYPGVSNIDDDLPLGKPETIVELTDRGRALGFDTRQLGGQLRDALAGAIARRFPRDNEEVTVRVRFPPGARNQSLLESLYLRAPDGTEVPLRAMARLSERSGFAGIRREDGRRQVAVIASLDEEQVELGEILTALERDGLPEIAARHGLDYAFKGEAEELAEVFGDMRIGFVLALAGIYLVLAWVFASFTRPLVVMAIIPFGLIGAVLGHWLLGFDLTVLSLVALFGLSGIVINDAIVLITTIDQRRHQQPLMEAVVDGCRERLRAVILTSATTIGGLTPLLFERSFQAQFLIPMAITLVFGLAVATFIVLLVVPALVTIQADLARRPAPPHKEPKGEFP